MYFPDYFYRPNAIQFALTLILVLLANNNGASFGTCPSGYCSTISGGPAFGLKIRNVEFHTLSNNTAGMDCTTEYQDFCSVFETFVQPNSSYDLIVESGDCPGAFGFGPRRIIVYIDWDQSSSFEASEVVMFEGDYDPLTMPIIADTVSVTIPSGATLGTTRMRVTCLEFTPDSTSAACNGVAGFGEVEDYRITIACMDADGDGFSDIACGGTDCNDADNTIFPGAVELPCDGVDNNCDTNIDENRMDADGDTFDECVDCNDADPTINPGAAELPCDNIDNNCDTNIDENRVDADGDGADECVDCNDGDSSNFPGNVEVCDGQDNNCDGNIDEGFLPTAICQNVTLFLDANGSGSIVPTDIDNGSNSSCGSVTLTASQTDFTCSDLGANNVTLTVRDPYLNEDSCVAVVTVIDSFLIKTCLPNADFAFTDKCLAVDFTDLSISNSIITSYQWDFGDGITSTSQHPSHTYVSPGTYLVCMLVHNQFGSDIKCDTVTVVTTLEEITGRDTTRTCSDNLTFNLASLITGGFSGSVQYGSTFGSYTDTITTDVMVSSDTTFYVRDSVGVSCVDTARIDITIETELPPMITCPPDVTLVCTDDNSSAAIGIPAVSDDCTAYTSIIISESDQFMIINEDTSIVQRTWTATDTLGSASMCVQDITLITEYIAGRDTTLACGTHTFNLADLITGSFGGSVHYGSTFGNYTEAITTDVTVSSDTTFYVRDSVGVGCVDTAVIHINIPSLNNCKIYVNAAVSGGNNDGTSWTDAFADLQDAIDAAYLRAVNTIWVAKGTYLPVADTNGNRNPSDPRDKTFFFDKGVRIYGGFAGGENMISERDHILNKTILSGNIGNNGISDNTYHVVYTQNAESLEVDGFTIEYGYADGSGMTHSMYGGGWYNESVGSGGISTPFIINCSFINNEAIYGGAMYNANAGHQCAPSIIASHFANNIADSGGAIYNTTKSSSGDCSPFIVSCTFYSNEGLLYGGAIMNEASMGIVGNNVIYSTFHNNSASIGAGGIHNNRIGNTATISTFIDLSIFWKNIGSVKSVSTTGGATAAVSYSLLEEGSCPGNGVTCMGDMIYNEDPLFVNAAIGDLHLQSCSPAVDHIIQSAVSFLDGDIDGDLRPQNGGVDLGADEYTGPICCPSITRIHVDSSATSGGDGSSWTMAFDTLQEAIDLACECGIDTIWVTEGTYYPTVNKNGNIPANPRDATFFFDKGLQLYGGFSGGETSLDERDHKSHPTILSGDLDNDDDPDLTGAELLNDASRDNNTFQIIQTQNVGNDFLIDGFHIMGGNASNGHSGGAWDNKATGGNTSSPIIRDCHFISNSSGGSGGALSSFANKSTSTASPKIARCVFDNNYAGNAGGAIYNLVSQGDAFSHLQIFSSAFTDNRSDDEGGAVFSGGVNGSASAITDIVGCIFSQNRSINRRGGAIALLSSGSTVNHTAHVTSSSFSGNDAKIFGGALYISESNSTTVATLDNNIIWGNTAATNNSLHRSGPASIDITHSLLEESSCPAGVTCGSGMIFNKDPLFIDSTNHDLRLKACSPAIDSGSMALLAMDTFDLDGDMVTMEPLPLDLDDSTRVVGAEVDIGAYEYTDTVSLNAAFTFSQDDCFSFQFTHQTADTCLIQATWDFGNGEHSALHHPHHTYDFSGTFLVCLTLQSPSGMTTHCDTVHVAPLQTWYQDSDGDGFGNPSVTKDTCAMPLGYVADMTDCDDTDSGVNPDATEVCNGIDDNCDGTIDEEVLITWYEDVDDDGYTSGMDSLSCDRPEGYKTLAELADLMCTNIFTDGFESGDLSNWTSVSPFTDSNAKASVCTSPVGIVSTLQSVPGAHAISPQSGMFFYAEQNPNGCLQARLNQDITIPANSLSWMTFYHTMMYDATGHTGNIKLGIKISIRPLGGAFTTLYEGEDIDLSAIPDRLSDTWHQVSIDLSAYSGMSQIRVEYLDADFPIQYGIDDVTIEDCMLDIDCDDTNSNANTGATEICNGIDDNCDGNIDEGLSMTWYRDSDMDGFGDPGVSKDTCAMPVGYVSDMTDCDDTDPNVNPDAIEICDNIDNNCDTEIDLDDYDLVDIELPTVVCQDITIKLNANGMTTLVADDVDNGSSDNCGIDILTLSQTTFACADIGIKMVTLTATDVNGNVDSCTSMVTIEDALDQIIPQVTGPRTICPSLSDIPYSVSAIPGAETYDWSYSGTGVTIINNGAANITLNFDAVVTSGVLSVTPQSACSVVGMSGTITISIGDPVLCAALNCPPGHSSIDISTAIINDLNSLDIYMATITIESDAVISAPRSILYRAGSEVNLNQNFEVESGASFVAQIGTCEEQMIQILNKIKK